MSRPYKISPGSGEHRRLRPMVILRYGVYFLLFLFLYVLQTTPLFLEIFGIKPNLLLVTAVCLAMFEGEFIGGLYGAMAGVLLDLSTIGYFGFNAILMLIFCVLIGLAVIYLLRLTWLNATLLTAGAMLILELLHYYFYYAMWGYENVWLILVQDLLPGVLYTVLLAPLCFWLLQRLTARLHAGDRE